MPLIPYNPFHEIDRFFEEDWSDLKFVRSPKMDIYEEKGNVIAEIGLPGVDPKDINIEIDNNVLKLEAKTEKKEEKKEKGYYRKELSQGYCRRAVPLPVEVIGSKAKASYKDGILKIIVPRVEKTEKKKSGKIKIETEK
jgi:HSP20 family protein